MTTKITVNKKPFTDYLKRHHMSLQQLADRANTSKSTISRCLNGTFNNLKAGTLGKLLLVTDMQDATVRDVFSLSEPLHQRNKEAE